MSFHLMFVHLLLVPCGLLSGHLPTQLAVCSYCIFVFFLFVILVFPRFGFEGGVWFLIAPVPVHCLRVTFIIYQIKSNKMYPHNANVRSCFVCDKTLTFVCLFFTIL